MKITCGKYKGKNLLTPKNSKIRPSKSITKESIFNILLNNVDFAVAGKPLLQGGRFLDVCCGVGSVALEALSCGAAHIGLIDYDRLHLQYAKRNVANFLLLKQSSFIYADAAKLPKNRYAPYDIAYIDPDYNTNINNMLKSLSAGNWLKPGSLILTEISSKDHELQEHIENFPGLTLSLKRKYGHSLISFLHMLDSSISTPEKQ